MFCAVRLISIVLVTIWQSFICRHCKNRVVFLVFTRVFDNYLLIVYKREFVLRNLYIFYFAIFFKIVTKCRH